MPLNLTPLEQYRLQDRLAFQLHCRQDNALVAGVSTEGNGLVVHRANCTFLQKTIVLNDTDLTTYRKYGMFIQNFRDFQDLALASGVPLFFTCKIQQCRNLQGILNP